MASPGSIVVQLALEADKAAREAANFAKKLVGLEAAADGVDSGLRGAQTAIDHMGDGAAQAAPDLQRAETALDGVADEAELTAQRLRLAASNMAEGVRQGGTGVHTAATGIKTDLGEVGKESGAEFIGNIAEGIGSGTASLTDVVSGTLGGITNLAATLTGPLGIAAAGAAAGIGLVFQKLQGEAEAAKTRIDGIRGALQGVKDKASEAAEQAIFQQWIEDAQQTTGKIENVREVLGRAGVTAAEFQGALAGNPQDLETVRRKIGEQETAIRNAEQTQGGLTAEQGKYLKNIQMTKGEIDKNDKATGAVRRENEAITDLTKGQIGYTEDWGGELTPVVNKTETIRDALNGMPRNIPVNVTVHFRDTKGNPVDPGNPLGRMAVPEAAGRAAQPVTVNVYASGRGIPNSPRAVRALLESNDVRMGRRAGQPRAVAW